MNNVASKNLYDLLGNDVEDENDIPKEPTKEIVKKSTTSKKKDEAPVTSTITNTQESGSRGQYSRRGRGDGNESAFRDRGNGRTNNRSRPTDETGGVRERYGDRPRGGRGRGRAFDRHSATDRIDSNKQVSQGWGSNKGSSEWTEEQAGDAIAQTEASTDAVAATEGELQPENADGEAPVSTEAAAFESELENKTKSYAEYLAEKAARAPVEDLPGPRVPNEGARDDKKWANAKELTKNEDEDYFAGTNQKQKNLKQRKEKTVLDIDQRFVDPREIKRGSGDRGNRGSRGGRAPRGDRPPRGSGESRGSRGGYRGGSSAATGNINVSDESAFPTLGGK